MSHAFPSVASASERRAGDGTRPVGEQEPPITVPVSEVRASKRQDPMRVLADWQTVRVRTALGVQFRQTSRVMLRKPWWIPWRVYLWLFHSIVIDADEIEARSRG